MIDLVKANEFVFTPSAFIAAYIEQQKRSETIDTVSHGGNVETVPLYPERVAGSSGVKTVVSNYPNTTDLQAQYSGLTNAFYGNIESGVLSVSGNLVDYIGKKTTDTTTTTTSRVTLDGHEATVVLVLTYGTFRAVCSDAQATINSINTGVANYFNSLS